MPRGLDYSFARPSPESIKSGGYDFICRYLSPQPNKNISAQETAAALAAGLSIVLVWESTATRALDGFAAGAQDAHDALQVAQDANCGNIPAIYFAVDFDATEADQLKIDDYLHGAASILGLPRTGVYGGYHIIKRCFDNSSASWGWQTYAWSGGNWDSRAHLRQVQNGVSFNGMDVDIDEAIDATFGQLSPNDHDMENIQIIKDNKQNEFRRDGEDTVRQIFNIPSERFFTDVLGDSFDNVRLVPSDWPLDPALWASEREKLRPQLDAANARILTLQAELVSITAPKPTPDPTPVPEPIQPTPTPSPVVLPGINLEELLKSIWKLITKK